MLILLILCSNTSISCISEQPSGFTRGCDPRGAANPWLGSFRCHSHAQRPAPVHIMRNIAKGGHRGACGPDAEGHLRPGRGHGCSNAKGGPSGGQRGSAQRVAASEAAAKAAAEPATGVAVARAAARSAVVRAVRAVRAAEVARWAAA